MLWQCCICLLIHFAFFGILHIFIFWFFDPDVFFVCKKKNNNSLACVILFWIHLKTPTCLFDNSNNFLLIEAANMLLFLSTVSFKMRWIWFCIYIHPHHGFFYKIWVEKVYKVVCLSTYIPIKFLVDIIMQMV